MRKLHSILRIISYVAGVAGAACVVFLRDMHPSFEMIGFCLLGVMFCSFLGTLLIYTYLKLTR